MIKKISFGFLVISMLVYISIGFFQGKVIITYKADQLILKEDSISYNLANFRSFDLAAVIILISAATAGISNVLLVEKEGEKHEDKQII